VTSVPATSQKTGTAPEAGTLVAETMVTPGTSSDCTALAGQAVAAVAPLGPLSVPAASAPNPNAILKRLVLHLGVDFGLHGAPPSSKNVLSLGANTRPRFHLAFGGNIEGGKARQRA
jgi:hypothetical protein